MTATRHDKVLNSLKLLARDVVPVSTARIAAAIVYKREIVGFGVCSRKTHPLQKRFGKVPEAIYLHAEIDAISNAVRRMREVDFLKSSTLYIARMKLTSNREWVEGLACPCKGCARAIASFEIPSVVYTIGD